MKKLATLLLALLSCLGSAPAQEPLPEPTGTIADTVIAGRHMERSTSHFDLGQYNQVFEEARKARAIYQTWLGAESFEYARATHQMGVVKLAEGKPDEAQKWLREALPVYEKTVGALSEQVANTQEAIGVCLRPKFPLAAVSHIEKALHIRQQLYGLEHAEVARAQLNLGACYHQAGNTEKAIFYYEQCLETRKKVEGEAYRGDHSVYHNLGVIYDNKHDRAKAREYHLKSLNLRLAGTNLDEVAQSYLQLCYLEGESGNCEQALRYGAEGLRICKEETGNKIREAELYHAYGDACHGKGDFSGAEENYEQSLKLFRQEIGNDALQLADVLNSIAITSVSGPTHAREYLLEALAICEKNRKPAGIYAVVCGNLAENYDKFGDLDNAIKYARIALDALAPHAATEQHQIGTVWQNLGNYHNKKMDFAQSDHAYDQAENAFRSIYPSFHHTITAVIRNRASARVRQRDHARALPLLQESLSRLNQTGRDPRSLHALFQDWADMEARQDNYVAALALSDSAIAAATSRLGRFQEGLSQEYVLSNVFKGQVCLRYYDLTKLRVVLDEADSAFQRADNELHRCLNSAMRESDKSRLMPYATAISEGMIWVETVRSDAGGSTTFEKSERAKARALRAAFQETRARKLAGIPDSLLAQAHRLNVDIAFWEKTEHELEQAGMPQADPKRIEARHNSTGFRQQHDRLVRHFETKYTDYHRLRYDLRTETVPSVQRDLLRPGQTLLEYFTGDSVIFIYVIRPDTFRMVRISRDFPLEELVQDMRSGITDCGPESDLPAAMDRYARAAHRLYQKLVAPVAADIPVGDQIILVPDGLLTYIPFEALLTELPAELMDWHRYKYWVLQHDISYCYSATLLREMREREHRAEPEHLFLGMAPTYAGDTTAIKSSVRDGAPDTRLQALDYNDVEVDSLQHLLGGQIYTGADATKARFVQEAGRYRILHPALHGNADDRSGDYSFLAFYEDPDHGVEHDRLYVREVYNLALNADLVTLSACQTNIGELRRGEGIIGLTRAFAYAGAKSIVGSLWNAHDKNTMLFMVDFYRRLKSGARKDAALAGAKRTFIGYGDERAHPFFWAAFVGVGDMRAIKTNRRP